MKNNLICCSFIISCLFRNSLSIPRTVTKEGENITPSSFSSSSSSSHSSSWVLVGSPIAATSVVASDIDFSDGSPVAPGPVPSLLPGIPVVAVGTIESDGATLTTFYSFVENPPSWKSFATHSPGMPQSYDAFSLKFALGRVYLALRIAGEDISSVLRSGTSGSDGEFEGCYAFDGFLFDFAIDRGTGDMRLATSPDNVTVGVQSYAKKGWDVYPASDEFSTFLPLALPTPTGGISTVSVSQTNSSSGGIIVIAVSTSLNVTSVFLAPLSSKSNTLPSPLGKPFSGSQAAVATGGGTACVAVFDYISELRVSCADLDLAPGSGWTDLGPIDPPHISEEGLLPALALAVSKSGSRTLFAAARSDSTDATNLLISQCSLSSVGQPVSSGCAGGQWTKITLVAPSPITAFDLKVNSFINETSAAEVYAIVTTGAAVGSDQVLVYSYEIPV
jgi:hypothetical protein